jgi:acetyl esterase
VKVPLDPQVAALREARLADGFTPLYEQTIEEARAADLAAIQATAGEPEKVDEVSDRTIPGPAGPLPVRLYRPVPEGSGIDLGDDPQTPEKRGMPTLVYFFGGGWVLGSIDTSDAICRHLANAVPCQVVTVGYRLAPEDPFPAAVHDCHAAVRWIAANAAELGADPDRIAVGGDSAGGNLAAVTAQQCTAEGIRLAGQLLVYPNTLYGADTASMRDNDDSALFNRRSVAWYWRHYLTSPDEGQDPRVSPLLAEDLTGLPPALVITAEYDPLRDEGERYADRLGEAGVPVLQTRYAGMVHGFFAMSGVLDGGRRAMQQAADWLAGRWAVV